jgi:DNA-directed RNA polymerase specialized sigma24 family protein
MTFIAKGKENAISRQELCLLLGLPDRAVRKLIQDARDRGEVILNDSSGAGYFTSSDIGELKRQYRTNRNRALSVLRQQKYLRRKIEELEMKDQCQIIDEI